MESVRARIFFAESLSDRATPQMKCIILVPRSECPHIRSLKEHIRNKFNISEGQHLELSIDGFVIPDWEKSEVIRENDVICVRAMKASTQSHTDCTSLEERSHKKKKLKRSREPDTLNCDSESGMHEVAQLVHDVQDGMQTKKKKKIQDNSKRKIEDETATLNKVEDKLKTKHKKKDKEKTEGKSQKRKKDRDADKSKALAETKMGKDHNDENNETRVSRELFTNHTLANGSELQAGVSSAQEIAEFSQTHYKASSQDVLVNGKSTADESILSKNGVTETPTEGSAPKKRRRRKRKKKSSMITTGNGDSLESAPNNNPSKPGYSMPRNRMLESDRVKNSTRIVNGVQNKSTMSKDETVAIATAGDHIVFESESDGENELLKLQPSEQVLESEQSNQVETKGTPSVDGNIGLSAQQHMKTPVEDRNVKNVRTIEEKEERKAASLDCVTPPEAGDEVTGESAVQIPETRSYDTYPPLNGPPRNGDIIAFKVLELSSEYCPEVSEYKEGVVTEFNPSTQYVGIQLTKGPASNIDLPDVSEGRFEMELDEEWTTDRNQQKCASLINVLLTSMIEPKLLSV